MSAVKFAFRAVGGTLKWALIVGGLVIVAVVIVAIVGLGKGVSDANKTAARVAPLMSKVHLGETERQVRSFLGAPDSTQQQTDASGRTDYWYYGTLATKGTWQLVFTNGRLTAKNRY
ncbi:MAG TPA: hypothetical protein VFA44_05200 [Gaiellaceae bacterium]|nr:hypothetical protein [Gaiellaceae bacterium]